MNCLQIGLSTSKEGNKCSYDSKFVHVPPHLTYILSSPTFFPFFPYSHLNFSVTYIFLYLDIIAFVVLHHICEDKTNKRKVLWLGCNNISNQAWRIGKKFEENMSSIKNIYMAGREVAEARQIGDGAWSYVLFSMIWIVYLGRMIWSSTKISSVKRKVF